MLTQLELDEMRAWCNCPTKFQIMDLFGVGLAVFFTVNGLRQLQRPKERPWAMIQLGLAGSMVWIHTRRFIYGSKAGTHWENAQLQNNLPVTR